MTKGMHDITNLALAAIEIQSKKADEKGIVKYGTALHHELNYDWLAMAFEEKVDDFKYMLCEMQRRKYIEEILVKARNADSLERTKDLIDVALIEMQKGRIHG